jgi:hypothetical protein
MAGMDVVPVGCDAQGNVDLENLDGTDHRILSPSIAPTSPFPKEAMIGFTPDQRAVLVQDTSVTPSAIHVISTVDGSAIDVADAAVGGTPFGAPRFAGASPFSSDGSEVLLQSTTALVAVTLATSATRTIEAFGPQQSSAGAVFLDDQHVLWVRVDDHSSGDVGSFAESVHVTGPGPTDDVVIDNSHPDNSPISTITVSPEGFIALGGAALLVKPDGTVLVPNDVSAYDILGVTPDGKGVIVSALDGVRYVGMNGTTQLIVTPATTAGGLMPPFAAYTPQH